MQVQYPSQQPSPLLSEGLDSTGRHKTLTKNTIEASLVPDH